MDIETFRNYCLAKKGVTEEMPFGPDTLVFKLMGKIFALAALDEFPLRVNLKCDPEDVISLREEYPDHILPGYHYSFFNLIFIHIQRQFNCETHFSVKRNGVKLSAFYQIFFLKHRKGRG